MYHNTNVNTKSRKNNDKRIKVEIACLLERNEKTIRLEIKKGLTKNLTSDWIEVEVYSAYIAHQKYLYNFRRDWTKAKNM